VAGGPTAARTRGGHNLYLTRSLPPTPTRESGDLFGDAARPGKPQRSTLILNSLKGGIMPTMSRTRVALIAGSFMLVSAAVVGCCAPAFLEPQPPWHDPVAQQEAWDRILRWLVVVAGGLLFGAFPLLAYGFVRWRIERRASLSRAAVGRARSVPGPQVTSGDDGDRRGECRRSGMSAPRQAREVREIPLAVWESRR
jgi:hypothetical protein